MQRKSSRVHRPKLVCLECRKRKLGCDKLRPECTRCKQNGYKCFYGGRAEFAVDAAPQNRDAKVSPQSLGHTPPKIANSTEWGKFHSIFSTVPDGIANVMVYLCVTKDMLVVRGPITFLDYPFAIHSIVQHDRYTRAICGSLHGITLIELSNHLNRQQSEQTPQRMLSPLPFIEKAMKNYMGISRLKENQNSLVSATLPSLENEKSLITAHTLIKEVESVLMDKQECEALMKIFYGEIYPFYPFMDISLFESNLKELFFVDDTDRWKFILTGKEIRKKTETLSVFLIMLSMGLKHRILSGRDNSSARTASFQKARQLSGLAYKLINLLDVFHYTNENGFVCALYYYICQYFDPEATDVSPSHAQLLTLKHLLGLATTLGLQHDPSKYARFKDPQIAALRRALWSGIQSLVFQISLTEGASDSLNHDHMKLFLREMQDTNAYTDEDENATGKLRAELFEISDSKYKLHMQLSKLLSACTPTSGYSELFVILVNINESEDIMNMAFPLHTLYNNSAEQGAKHIELERGAVIDVENIKKSEIFLGNLVGRLCILNVYDMLSLYFENECSTNWEENGKYFQYLTLQSFRAYLDVAGMISDYLIGRFGEMGQRYGYAANKHVCFALVRLWIFQSRFLLRFSYKKHAANKQSQSANIGDNEIGKNKYIAISESITMITGHLRNQMAALINLAENTIEDSYLACYQAVSIFRYIVYVLDENKLMCATNEFWQRISEGRHIPHNVLEMVALKWGLEPRKSKTILHNLMDPHALRCLDQPLMDQMESIILASNFGRYSQSLVEKNMTSELSGTYEYDVLTQILESNSEAFWDFLNDGVDRIPH